MMPEIYIFNLKWNVLMAKIIHSIRWWWERSSWLCFLSKFRRYRINLIHIHDFVIDSRYLDIGYLDIGLSKIKRFFVFLIWWQHIRKCLFICFISCVEYIMILFHFFECFRIKPHKKLLLFLRHRCIMRFFSYLNRFKN